MTLNRFNTDGSFGYRHQCMCDVETPRMRKKGRHGMTTTPAMSVDEMRHITVCNGFLSIWRYTYDSKT